jgi:hypothetical protein
VFRASGRFVWPLAMLLPLWGCARLAGSLSARRLAALLALLLALQAYDLSGKWAEFTRRFAPGGLGALPALSEPAWRAAADRRHLVVLPADRAKGWIEPALFAARHGLSVNLAHVARGNEAAFREAEARAVSELLDGRPRSDTAYWVRDPALVSRLPPSLDAVARRLPLGSGVMIVAR